MSYSFPASRRVRKIPNRSSNRRNAALMNLGLAPNPAKPKEFQSTVGDAGSEKGDSIGHLKYSGKSGGGLRILRRTGRTAVVQADSLRILLAKKGDSFEVYQHANENLWHHGRIKNSSLGKALTSDETREPAIPRQSTNRWASLEGASMSELLPLAERLSAEGRQGGSRELIEHTLDLVHKRELGAAAALEACGRLNLADSAKAFLEALTIEQADSLIAQVAAQRIRMINVEDKKQRNTIVELLKRRIEQWATSRDYEDSAKNSFLSVSLLEGYSALPWLSQFIESSPSSKIVEASAHAACSIPDRGIPQEHEVKDAGLKMIYQASKKRLSEPSEHGKLDPLARARLIETVGVFGSWLALSDAANFVVNTFENGSSIERAAAIRVATRMAKAFGNSEHLTDESPQRKR